MGIHKNRGLIHGLRAISDNGTLLEGICAAVLQTHSSITGWSIGPAYSYPADAPSGLRLHWHNNPGATPLMAPCTNAADLARLIINWLDQQDYGRGPDTDGDANKGYEILGVDCCYYALVIGPQWVVYSK